MNNSQSLNLTAIMKEDGIGKIERVAGRFLVVMVDGRAGVGGDVAEALAKATKPDAFNTRKAA